LKKILGKTDIEDALKRLDTLTTEEARLAIAETLKVTNRVDDKVDKVDDKVDKVDDKVDKVDDKVDMVDDKVDKVDNTVNRVDTKVDNVDDKVGKVDSKVGKVDDKVDKVDDKVDKVDDKVDKVDNKVMVLIGGRESFPCNLRIPEHGYYSKRAVCKHRVTRESAKVAISSRSLHKP
jgi:chromosome segregation ATPase